MSRIWDPGIQQVLIKDVYWITRLSQNRKEERDGSGEGRTEDRKEAGEKREKGGGREEGRERQGKGWEGKGRKATKTSSRPGLGSDSICTWPRVCCLTSGNHVNHRVMGNNRIITYTLSGMQSVPKSWKKRAGTASRSFCHKRKSLNSSKGKVSLNLASEQSPGGGPPHSWLQPTELEAGAGCLPSWYSWYPCIPTLTTLKYALEEAELKKKKEGGGKGKERKWRNYWNWRGVLMATLASCNFTH